MIQYGLVDGAERLEKYTPGGFHPILIGDKMHHRYEVVDKLGYGGWSTFWLVHDPQEQRYLALKVGIADSLPREVPILRALGAPSKVPGFEHIPHMLDEFTVTGPNGSHPCIQALFSSAFYTEKQVMCQRIDILGLLPDDWYKKWEYRYDFFELDRQPKHGRHVSPGIEQTFRNRVQKYRGKANMVELCAEEEAAFLDMMKGMLRCRPEQRYTAQQVLECDWVVKWAHPDYKRSRASEACGIEAVL
ncbi:hypothetical protein NLG97_g9141 [Lecanicillium saksenae]|uniref:Uncharacterized protein n=1 Tax=Lecanicillium saksenae TaxID=468837 RepID=A0ACC1QIV1_9HYPO|nr:hypothetical protein NLG97_g9141 [Lecanicillium saksenae]